MNKYFLIWLVFQPFFLFQSYAQNNSSSPYTRYGIGDLSPRVFGISQSLGGTSIGICTSSQLTINNPASYTSFDSLGVRFEFGGFAKFVKYSNSLKSVNKNDINFNYLILGFPVSSRWKCTLGILPFSSIGYNINVDSTYYSANDTIRTEQYFDGSGGINQLFWGNAFKINKHLSFGINVLYLFGTLTQTRVVSFLNDDGLVDDYTYNLKNENRIIVNDFAYNFGLQYHNTFNNKLNYTIGLIFENNEKINSYNNLLVAKANSLVIDTLEFTDSKKDYFTLPMSYGIGFSVYNENILAAIDYYSQDWSKATFLGVKDSLTNSNRISAGIQFIPNSRSMSNYFSRINYRIGGHYSNTYLNLRGEQLKDVGLSFGLGFPIRHSKSAINLTFEIGKRGTTSKELIEEKYANFSLNFSLFDIWFLKNKFD